MSTTSPSPLLGDLAAALPAPARIYYSLKANPHPAIAGEVVRRGGGAEVSSTGELASALAGGATPADCLYSGPGKTVAEIENAISAGVTFFSVESAGELAKLAAVARRLGRPVDTMIRFNPDGFTAAAGLVMSGAPSQFGADESDIERNPDAFAGDEFARVVGLHCYLGSNLSSVADLVAVFTAIIATAARLASRHGIRLDVLDLGGGFAHPYATVGERPALAGLREAIEPVLDRHLPAWRSGTPRLIFESGRYLAGGCGTLVGTVLDAKESKGRAFAVLDFGINHFGGMAGLRRIPRVAVAVTADSAGTAVRPTTLTGPLCTPLDLVTTADLPPLAAGDRVSIPNVGAYGLTASLVSFLSHTPPAEVVVDGERLVGVSRLSLVRNERSL
ncbi:MAG: hypothetical protein R3D02_10605 [Hyphomicrobiales bacterium]